MTTAVFCLELLCIFTIFAAMVLLMAGGGAREQKFMCYFLCGTLVQNVGYLIELTAPTMEAALAAVKMEYLGSTFLPLCYCGFIFCYCYQRPPEILFRVLAAMDFVGLAFIMFLDRHPWFYSSVQWLEDAGHHYLELEYGWLYPITTVTRIFLPYLLSIWALVRTLRATSDPALKKQYASFLVISALPMAALLIYALKVVNIYDVTPMTFGLSVSLVAILVWSRRNYDFSRVAADAVLDSMADGVVAVDEQDRLVSYNRAAAEIFPQLKEVRVGEQVKDPQGYWRALMDEGVARTLELNGRFYESHAKQITASDGRVEGHVILVLDITDTRNYIDEIVRVREQAEKANMAKSEFLANMSHEIRTPMNAIIGLSDIIMEESQGQKVFSHAKDVQAAAQSLLAIINDILDLSKVEAGRMEMVLTEYHIGDLAGEVTGMMDMAASQRGLILKSEFDPEIPCRYRGDEGRIKQILINLLNNAVKFTREGSVKLSVTGRPGEDPDTELLVFSVEDTGCGIRKEDQVKIFEDFKQVDSKRNRSVEGTGLGLSIVKRLVDLMGGTIELESEYEAGSTFTVTIPQRIVDPRPLSQAPHVPERQARRVETFTAPGFRVLVVDDNAVNRRVATGFLNPYGFQIAEAESGPEAIELVRSRPFDLIFMDHMMPGMDGIEATRIIRRDCGKNGRDAAIVALTANAMEGVRDKFLENGFDDFIAKPLDRQALGELLLRWVPAERRQPLDEEGAQPELDPSLIQIEGIDPQAVLKYHAGSLEDYRALLDLYCTDGRRKLDALRLDAAGEDYEDYEIEVHALKSASANIGAMELSARARAHEEAALRGDGAYIREDLPALLDLYERLLESIRGYLGMREEDGGDLPELGREDLRERAQEALGQLESFRSHECQEIVADLLRHKLPGETAGMLKEIQGQLKLYEDDAAEELLRRLVERLEEE